MPFDIRAFHAVAMTALFLTASAAGAASVAVQVLDAAGHALADAVVYAEPASGQAPPKPVKTVEIEQKGRQFSPLVTVVQAGTAISFPNNDTVRHHVYSFSPTKPFELKLYSGVPANPVNFDKPGTVVIGCNIHDQMVAYIHVVSTPYFGKTDATGKTRLQGVMPGKYRLKAWHHALPAGAQIPEQTIDMAANDVTASFRLNLKSSPATN